MWQPEPGVQTVLTVTIILFLILNFISVGLRVYVRTTLTRSFGYDDYSMLAGFAGYAAMCATLLASMIYGFGATKMDPSYNLKKAAQAQIAFQLVYVFAAYLCKLSVALVLLRIANTDKKSIIRLVLLLSIGVVTIFAITTFILLALQCRPLSLTWGEGKGSCFPAHVITDVAYAFSAADIASGWLYATLPMVLLWNVQLSLRVKLSVIFLLGLSFTSSIATLVRLKYVVDLGTVGSADPELPHKLLDSIVWSHLEIALAIFAASLAALRPLLKFITGKEDTSYKRSRTTGTDLGSSIRMDPWNEINADNRSNKFILHENTSDVKAGFS